MSPSSHCIRCCLGALLPLLAACGTASQAVVPDPIAESTAPAYFPDALKAEHTADETGREFDLNGDERADMWKFYRQGEGEAERLVRKEADLNHDGKVDLWRYYGPDGRIVMDAYDFDFDGRIDQINFYEKGSVIRKEKDLNSDGKTDLWIFYEQGKIVRKERDSDGNEKPDYWEYWEDGHVSRIGEDLDGDGEVDRWSKAPSEDDEES